MKKRRRKKNFFKTFWEAFWRSEMLILPGQIAFFLFLSLVPTITLIGYACSYFNISNDLIYTLLSNVFSSEVSSLITPVVTSTDITPAFFITLGVGYFIASNGMASIIVASNTIYGIHDSGFFRRRLKAMLIELIIVILMLFVLIVPLLSQSIITIIQEIDVSQQVATVTEKVFTLLNGPISWIIIFLFIKLIYTLAPDRKVNTHSINTGAVFTTICWIGTTALYAYYINHFANYSLFYGALANIVVLMLWIYFLSYFFVIGMAMNYREEIEETGIIDLKSILKADADSSGAGSGKKETIKEKIEKKFTKKKKKETEEIKKDEKEEQKKE
jgi:membrane protein